MLFVEEKWKIERDCMIWNDIDDPRKLVKIGNQVNQNLDRQVYQHVQSSNLSLICLFQEYKVTMIK